MQKTENNTNYIYTTYQKLKKFFSKNLPYQEVEDFIQEVFLKFYRTSKFIIIKKPASFIFKIAHNLIIDYYRKKEKIKKEIFFNDFTYLDNHKTYNNNQDKTFQEIEILNILESLSEQEKLILKMKIIDKLTFKEISQKLKINTNTLLSKFRRLLKKLQKVRK